MNTFSTTAGVVTLSKPYFTLMCDQQQIEVKYTPNHCQGWGICKVFNAIECSDFSQADAELFALNAESKLKLTGEISMTPIQAAVVERIEGYWTHPDLPEWDEGATRAECEAWAADNGGEFVSIWFEMDAPENLIERYYDDGDIDISDWQPVCDKAGSFLLSIHDTEDGPVALFFAPKDKEAA
ncbi:hypothetical protein GCM10007984_23590 [Shewanella putrefaciens]|nr:hypothetical protein GCM10007984_23590 [Shewanella putrefaciens]